MYKAFNRLYYRLENIARYLKQEEKTINALKEFYQSEGSNEQEILKWLVAYEDFGIDMWFLMIDYFEGEDETQLKYIDLSEEYKVMIKVSDFKSIIEFNNLFYEHYWNMLEKYKTITEEEHRKLDYESEESQGYTSLTYQLKKRGMI